MAAMTSSSLETGFALGFETKQTADSAEGALAEIPCLLAELNVLRLLHLQRLQGKQQQHWRWLLFLSSNRILQSILQLCRKSLLQV